MLIIITKEDKELYSKEFTCEALTCNIENKILIQNFYANDKGKNLEKYLKECAWEEDIEGETKVYLVKDKNNQIALYFSIKCGLLCEPYEFSSIEDVEQDFVNMIVDALERKDNKLVQQYLESGYYDETSAERLYRVAKQKYNVKCENREMQDAAVTYKVSKSFSSIELCHFCKNVNYEYADNSEIPIGFALFWEVVVPKILEVANLIGCKYLYLFAADQSEIEDRENRSQKLVRYYKNDLRFREVQDLIIIKPQYDEFCFSLIQEIKDLRSNREGVWEAYTMN